ncbi:hypothetical protein DFJ64_2357 [Thermasporomyces composti]|uniref:DNA-binding phage zinc finger domain-containing protein n=1 Tax=Thermasporomyces composti TaxID=696763 RepID=A0A3D9V542_THECX|nr:hypothetical protein DFJ64_2357 [Thermasporomyces composti]
MATWPGDRTPHDTRGDMEGGHIRGVGGDRTGAGGGHNPLDLDLIDSGIVDWVFDTSRPDLDGLGTADRHRFARILLHPCPTCHAPPGHRCVRRGSGEEILRMDDQHQPRRHAITTQATPPADARPDHV